MKKIWWKEKVIYQVYPRSFYDTDNDGIGDLNGITKKLDYIKDLGVDIIWLNPIYKSPNDDNGYDISDYMDIMDEFGTMADFDRMLSETHKRDMKLIMDLVLNHTSDEHPWFLDSRSDKKNPRRDFYIWKKGKDNGPPNNWESLFGGQAWEYDEKTGEYYLHVFTKKQPDLNWDNPLVRKEIYKIIDWWLDKGVDGFRIDAINIISKNRKFPDDMESRDVKGRKYYINGKNVHKYLREMRKKCFAGHDVVTIGECGETSIKQALLYTMPYRKELDMIFPFEHVIMDYGLKGKFDIRQFCISEFAKIISRWQLSLNNKSWNTIYLTNHDQPRALSRYANDNILRIESGKLLATLLLTLQGTPFIYQGEEIGMTNVMYENIGDYKDIEIFNYFKIASAKGIPEDEIMKGIYYHGRDNSRTPMQWDDTDNSGFTKGIPWIKINLNYKEINVKNSLNDKNSIFNYYKKLIGIRKNNPGLIYGNFIPLDQGNENVFSYLRSYKNERYVVILNFNDKISKFIFDKKIKFSDIQFLIGNYNIENYFNISEIHLMPYEARVFKLL